jgi:hypothetical protein
VRYFFIFIFRTLFLSHFLFVILFLIFFIFILFLTAINLLMFGCLDDVVCMFNMLKLLMMYEPYVCVKDVVHQ